MKKILVLILAISVFVSLDIYLKYELDPVAYFKASLPVSVNERKWLEKQGGIIYGADRSAYPLSFYNEDSQQLEGILVDYFSHISIENSIKVTPVALGWGDVMEGLEDGRIMTADLFVSSERRRKFDFTQSVYTLSGNIVTLKPLKTESGKEALQKLQGSTIAVVEEDYSKEHLLRDLDWPVKDLIETGSIRDAMKLLDGGRVDAVMGDEAVLESYCSGSRKAGKYFIPEEPVYSMPVCFAVKKGNDELLSILNKCVLQLKKDNIIRKTQDKWYGNSAPITRDYAKYTITMYVVALILIVFFLINRWNYVLRKGIRAKTTELETSKNNIRRIIDTINLGILVVDREKNIIETNMWVETFEKKTRDAMIGHNISEFRGVSGILQNFNWEEPAVVSFENLYYEVTARPIEYTGGLQGLVIIDDITKKITDEKMLRQQSKMIAVGHLSAGLAHEIRNPLGLIKSYLFIIGRNISGEKMQEAVQVCDNSVRRINNLITTLLNFSKTSEKSEEPVELDKILSAVVALEEKEAQRQQIQIRWICKKLNLHCDEESLKVILINLVENAIEALSEEEKDYKEILITAECMKNVVRIQVADNGKPIGEDVREHIFDPFFTTKEKGTGLGLYLVNNEVEKIGGSISLDCMPGGNAFNIIVPLPDADKK